MDSAGGKRSPAQAVRCTSKRCPRRRRDECREERNVRSARHRRLRIHRQPPRRASVTGPEHASPRRRQHVVEPDRRRCVRAPAGWTRAAHVRHLWSRRLLHACQRPAFRRDLSPRGCRGAGRRPPACREDRRNDGERHGPHRSGKGGFVLPRFIGQALRGEPITVYGDGSMVRAFTHVADIADGLIAAMARGGSGEAYNLGNPANKTSILDLAQRVLDRVGGPSKIDFVDPKELFGPLFEEANDKYPDADKSMSELGWRPKYDIDRVILDTA